MGRILLSVCALVVAVCLAGTSQPANKASRQEQADPASAVSARAPSLAIPPHSHPEMEDLGCERGQNDRGSDLCAQWKAADAARASADAAWLLGVLGLGIGGLTLLAASRAAHWAKAAATETKRSADIATNAYVADTRAWLAIKTATVGRCIVDRGGDGATLITPYITAWVENYGNGPAINCTLEVAWKRPDDPWSRVQDMPYLRAVNFDSLMPKTYDANIQVFSIEALEDVWDRGLLYLWVRVTYQTVGEEAPRTTTQQIVVAEHIEPMSLRMIDRALFEVPGDKNLKSRVLLTEMT